MEMFVTCLLLLPLLPVLWWTLWRLNEILYVTSVRLRSSKLNIQMPPGNLGFPFLGETLNFIWYYSVVRRPEEFINAKIRKYGENIGAYRTYLFGAPSIIACSPEVCKFVLQSNDKFQLDWPTTDAQGRNSVITLQGAQHARIKSLIVQVITRPDSLSRNLHQVQPVIIDMLKSWSEREKFRTLDDVKKVFLVYAARYFAHLEVSSQAEEMVQLMSGVTNGFRAQAWNIPGTAYHHAIQCRKKLLNMLRKELERKRKSNLKNEEDLDLMDGLMQYKDKEGNSLTDDEVLDNILSTIHGSHQAIAYLVTWCLYFLSKSPQVLQKLREENMDMIKEKGGHISYKDISKLKYTNKVVEETIRMTNISGFVFRTATEDVEFKGYLIPKGWKVIVWLRHLHTDPVNFEDPASFNPDRWDVRPKHGTFLPFGGGVRTCPGQQLARMNLAVFLHHLSVGYKWKVLKQDSTIRYLSHPHFTDGLEVQMSRI